MFTEADASQIAEKYYGMTMQASRLPGEYDANFHLKSKHGDEFILKISHPDESLHIVVMQNTLLQFIENELFSAPRLLPVLTGELFALHRDQEGKSCYVRIFTFLPGQLLANVGEQTPAILMSLGEQLGYLTTSLNKFHHSAAERYLKWDLLQSHWIAEHLSQLNQGNDQSCVKYFMQRFTKNTTPELPTLRRSVIHGDVNDYNIIVSDALRVSGFIDFGDMVKTATVCELSIALAYVMLDKPDPLAAAATVIKAYHAVFPLQEAELAVLFDLICMRLCVSVVNSALRKQENPEDAYLVISERPAWQLLKKLHGVSANHALSCFHAACG